MNIFKEIKYFVQRGKRGYSDRDLWSINDHIADIIIGAVRWQKDNGMGCPSEYFDDKNKNNECEKWGEILEEIAQGLEAYKEITEHKYSFNWKENDKVGYKYEYDPKRNKQLTAKFNKGMGLFTKHFFSLWD